MDPRLVSAFLVLFIASNHVNARFELSLMNINGNDDEKSEAQEICSSCAEASNRAQQSLSNTDLFEEIELLSAEACQMLPSNLKTKCLEKAGAYIYQTKFLLQGLFQEISACKVDAELCLHQSPAALSITQHAAVNSFRPDNLEVCVECRRAIKTIFDGIESTKSKRKILGFLVDYCSESGKNEKQCKVSLNKYFPLLMSQVEELQPNEVCRMMSFCR